MMSDTDKGSDNKIIVIVRELCVALHRPNLADRIIHTYDSIGQIRPYVNELEGLHCYNCTNDGRAGSYYSGFGVIVCTVNSAIDKRSKFSIKPGKIVKSLEGTAPYPPMTNTTFFSRAAFEKISRIDIQPLRSRVVIDCLDIRHVLLPEERPPFDNFDPRDHRQPANPIKLHMAYFNILRTVFGAGVLGMPLAISQAGIILGPTLAIAVGYLLVHGHLTLLWCLNEISRQLAIPYISYRYGFRVALLHGPPCLHSLGHNGPTIVAILMVLSQVGICTVFVIFTADCLRDILDHDDSVLSMAYLFIPYLILTLTMKKLKQISYVSLLGNLLNFIGLVLVIYLTIDDPHGEVIKADFNTVPMLFAFGTFLFNLSSVGVVLTLDKALVNPKVLTKRYGVIPIGILIPTLITTVFGIMGYWSFGAMEENILRALPFDSYISMVAIGLYMIAVGFAFPILCYPGIQIFIEVVQNRYELPHDGRLLKITEFVARPLFVVTCFLISYAVPFQGPFVAFVGNLCTSQLALIFPSLMELSILYPDDYGKYSIFLIKNVLLILLGLCASTFGIYSCGYLLYVRIVTAESPNFKDLY